MSTSIIGIDLGATLIKSAIILDGPKFINKKFTPTNRGNAIDQLLDVVKSHLAFAKLMNIKLEGIGIGIPGVVDKANGIIKFTLNLGLKDIKIKEILHRSTGLPVRIDNDRNLGLLGEFYYGMAKNCQNTSVISWGTGVACSLLINGSVYYGAHNIVTEFGHTSIRKNGKTCRCGNKGCLGAYSGGDAIVNSLNKLLHRDGIYLQRHEVIVEGLKLSYTNIKYQKVFDCAIDNLALGISNLCNIIDPEKIVIWGGISNLPNKFFNELNEKVKKLSHPTYRPHVNILRSRFKQKAGLAGAFALFDKNIK